MVVNVLRLCVLFLILSLVGCDGKYSYQMTTDNDGVSSCVISVRNQPLASLLDSLAKDLNATIETQGGIDRDMPVTIKLKGQSWEAVLQEFCNQQGWSLAYAEDTKTYTISAGKSD